MRRHAIFAALGLTCIGWFAWSAAEVRPVPGTTSAIAARSSVPARAPDVVPAGAPASGGALLMPVAGADPARFRDSFREMRGTRRHEAIDILAPRGTPVLAVADGVVAKLFDSANGGLTVYQFAASGTRSYYYAHLDGYAAGLHEGQTLRCGQVIGRVGTTGNAPPGTPHLHFGVSELGPEQQWWGGTALDPYPLLASGR